MTVVAHPTNRVLAGIAILKFAKATLLVVVGLGALELLRPGVAARAQSWASALGSSTGREGVQRALARVSTLDARRLRELGIGAFLYAGLFTVEGIGLWREKRWAEYLTVIATASFVPLEAYELARDVTLPRISALVLNVLVVVYLVYRLRQPRR
jgi:uncharacterized membrane protein (DUF2068 family)